MTEHKYESLSSHYAGAFDAVRDALPEEAPVTRSAFVCTCTRRWENGVYPVIDDRPVNVRDARCPIHGDHRAPPARPERHLYAAGEALAEERRARRDEQAEARRTKTRLLNVEYERNCLAFSLLLSVVLNVALIWAVLG